MILVTGANGFVGSHLVPRLVREKDAKIRALVRASADVRALEVLKVDIARGDIADLDSLRRAMDGADTVIHLVAIPIERGKQTFEAVNINGTRKVVAAAKEQGVKRFIHLSALGASNDPRYPYTYSKWLGEEAVRGSGLNFTVLQPGAQFGEGDGFFSAFAGLLSLTPFIFPSPGKGDTVFQPIWVEDVVTTIIKSLDDAKTMGQTIEFGGPEHLAYDELIRTVMEVTGKQRRIVHVPVPLMRVPVFFFSLLPYPPVDSGQLDLLQVRNATDSNATERWFGFKPTRLREGLDYLKHFDLGKWLRGRLTPP
jgi:NADH dehydrogenase